jgi:YHS domain-containing protein
MAGFTRRLDLDLVGFFDSTRPAILDDEHMARVNYEAYFFASKEGRERFLTDPVSACGLITDPVSKRRFHPDERAPRLEHGGVLYVFETRENLRMFRKRPDDYRLPGYTM